MSIIIAYRSTAAVLLVYFLYYYYHYYFLKIVTITILIFNLRVVDRGVSHFPWLTKLTHNTTTHETTEVANVRLSAKKFIIFSTVKASKHPGIVSAATGWPSVFLAPLEKHCCFYFAPFTSWLVWGSAWRPTPRQPGREELLRFRVRRPSSKGDFFFVVQDCCRLLRFSSEDLRCVINHRK